MARAEGGVTGYGGVARPAPKTVISIAANGSGNRAAFKMTDSPTSCRRRAVNKKAEMQQQMQEAVAVSLEVGVGVAVASFPLKVTA